MSVSEISSQSTLHYIESVKTPSVSSIIDRYRDKYSDMKYIYSDWQKYSMKEMNKMNDKLEDAISRNKSEYAKTLKLYESISLSHNKFVSSMNYYKNRPKKRKISEIE